MRSRAPTYRVKFRRRRESRTDYYYRLKLLSSLKTRLVARITNSQVIAHLTDYDGVGDKTLFHASSRELSGYGWKGGANTSAAYLTGLLLGKKAGSKVSEAILDIGLQRPVPGAKIFAVAKGLQDAGVKISIGAVVPSEDRLAGKHIEEYAKSLSDEQRSKQFGAYIKSGLDPTKFSTHVQEVITKLGVKIEKKPVETKEVEKKAEAKPEAKPETKPEKKLEEKPKAAPKKDENPEKEQKAEVGEKDGGN